MTAETSTIDSHAGVRVVPFAWGVALAMFLSTAAAHHSFAMFDARQSVTLRGVVKEFRWTNPHVFIQLMATDSEGAAPVEWSIEMTSPEHLVRAGWKPGTLKSGDKVTLVIHPIRGGGKGGQFVSGIAADGAPLGVSRPPHAQEPK